MAGVAHCVVEPGEVQLTEGMNGRLELGEQAQALVELVLRGVDVDVGGLAVIGPGPVGLVQGDTTPGVAQGVDAGQGDTGAVGDLDTRSAALEIVVADATAVGGKIGDRGPDDAVQVQFGACRTAYGDVADREIVQALIDVIARGERLDLDAVVVHAIVGPVEGEIAEGDVVSLHLHGAEAGADATTVEDRAGLRLAEQGQRLVDQQGGRAPVVGTVGDIDRAAVDDRIDPALDGVERGSGTALVGRPAGRRHMGVGPVGCGPGLVLDRHAVIGRAHGEQTRLLDQGGVGSERTGRRGDRTIRLQDPVQVDIDPPLIAEHPFAVAGQNDVRPVGILDRDRALGVFDRVIGNGGAGVAPVDQHAVAHVVDVVAGDGGVLGPVAQHDAARGRGPAEGDVALVGVAEDFEVLNGDIVARHRDAVIAIVAGVDPGDALAVQGHAVVADERSGPIGAGPQIDPDVAADSPDDVQGVLDPVTTDRGVGQGVHRIDVQRQIAAGDRDGRSTGRLDAAAGQDQTGAPRGGGVDRTGDRQVAIVGPRLVGGQ